MLVDGSQYQSMLAKESTNSLWFMLIAVLPTHFCSISSTFCMLAMLETAKELADTYLDDEQVGFGY
jgi:hypothetical protein